ncbi:hypothetical protein Bbelb_442360 [Branchiostoma belcheri]|nr:hypothetical protein Bbelb_442360 [Branchiostoma belcheri]
MALRLLCPNFPIVALIICRPYKPFQTSINRPAPKAVRKTIPTVPADPRASDRHSAPGWRRCGPRRSIPSARNPSFGPLNRRPSVSQTSRKRPSGRQSYIGRLPSRPAHNCVSETSVCAFRSCRVAFSETPFITDTCSTCDHANRDRGGADAWSLLSWTVRTAVSVLSWCVTTSVPRAPFIYRASLTPDPHSERKSQAPPR